MSNIGKAIRKANNTPFIKYYPELGKAFNSICAAVLLKQIDYLFEANGNEPFFKFKAPCEHKLYQVGRSWVEELGVNRGEFEGALSRLGAVKVTKGIKLNEVKLTSLIVYYTDKDRVTWYWLNLEMYEQILETAFTIKGGNDTFLCKAEKSLYIEKGKSDFTFPIKELKKDKSEEKKKITRPPSGDGFLAEGLWRLKYKTEPDLNDKLNAWILEQAKSKIAQAISSFNHSYSQSQLDAYVEKEFAIKSINYEKLKVFTNGDIMSCDTVEHIINTAKVEMRNTNTLSIPLPKKDTVKRTLPAEVIFHNVKK